MNRAKSRLVARVKKVAVGRVSTAVSTPMRVKPCAIACSTSASPGNQPFGPWMVRRKPSG
jgi:hypothetical protein